MKIHFIYKLKKDEGEGFVNKLMVSPREYQSVNDDILEGRSAKQRCGEHQQGVEPTAGCKKIVHKVRVTSGAETLQFIQDRIEKNKRTNVFFYLFFSTYPFSSKLLIIHLLGTHSSARVYPCPSAHSCSALVNSLNEVSREVVSILHLSTSFHPSLHLFIHPFIHSLPSPRLVDAFCDEVCRETVLKLFPVFKGVVDLGVRHAAALKPAVKHLCDPPQDALTAPWWDCQIVDAGQRKCGQNDREKEKGGTTVETNGSNNNLTNSVLL